MASSLGTLGSAYVQIVPSAKGISGSITKSLNGEAASAGSSAGATIASKIKGAITVAAIGKALTASIMEGAALEQSLGGVETLYKKHADEVVKNADKAYKTAGLSANAYMETATSFAASLLQSVNGNTQQAAKLTDMAIIDMSDNANKMGTDMQMIQDAYQGFAKQNYTMLDNLKLGYGGTKTEMERLLADAEKITGIKYDISNLSDVYSAIHVIQGELGITETTAKEAASTLSGSFAAMKSAAQNFMGDLALGRNVGPAMAALAESAATFLFDNLMPALGNIIISLPEAIYALIKKGGPKFLASGQEMIIGLAQGIETGTPKVLNQGMQTIANFANGLIKNLPKVITAAGTIISNILGYIEKYLPVVMQKGGELVGKIAMGILSNLPQIISAVLKVTGQILSGLVGAIPAVLNAGRNFISGIAAEMSGAVLNKLKSAMDKVKSAITEPIKTAINKVKSFFNITLKFKGIKLPHISISYNKSGALASIAQKLGLEGVPKFSVSWYKTGGIFNGPSVIGVGEAGAEAVVPLDALWSKMDNFFNAAFEGAGMSTTQNHLTENQIRVIVNETVTQLIGPITNSVAEGLDGIKMTVEQREFGRLVRGAQNGY